VRLCKQVVLTERGSIEAQFWWWAHSRKSNKFTVERVSFHRVLESIKIKRTSLYTSLSSSAYVKNSMWMPPAKCLTKCTTTRVVMDFWCNFCHVIFVVIFSTRSPNWEDIWCNFCCSLYENIVSFVALEKCPIQPLQNWEDIYIESKTMYNKEKKKHTPPIHYQTHHHSLPTLMNYHQTNIFTNIPPS